MSTMTLRSGDQSVYFNGRLLGSASSENPEHGPRKARWTEISIYATEDGKYVVSKVGRSRIVHASQDCRVLKNNEDPLRRVDLDAAEEDYLFCDPNLPEYRQCWTDESLNRSRYGYLENDHATATMADNAQGAVAACYSRDQTGVFSLSWLAKQALAAAFDEDEDLEDAYDHFDIGLLGRRTTR